MIHQAGAGLLSLLFLLLPIRLPGASAPEQSAPPPSLSQPAQEADGGEEPEQPRNTQLYILMYHHFVTGDGQGLNDWTLTGERFREDLQWLAGHGYTTVLPSQLAAGEPLPQRAVMITLDDGYASNYHIAYPLLQEFQAKAAIALIVGRTDAGDSNYLTWDMCREMVRSGLVEFGSHTYDAHKEQPRGIQRMAGESRQAYEARIYPDLRASVELLEQNLGTGVCYFAYPHGQTEPWADDCTAWHFDVTVTTRHARADLAQGLTCLPRYNVSMRTPVWELLPA